jgi:hypothetical protein
VTAVSQEVSGRLEMMVERFARREGQTFVLDLRRRIGAEMGKKSRRLVFR